MSIRIAIIGSAGAGKTTLAKQLHKQLQLPIYHLDQYYWKPGWQRSEWYEFSIIHDALCDQEAWIIDGIYTSALPYRLERATHIIFLDTPRYLCLWRLFKRLIFNYKKVLPQSAPECPERFDKEFLKWVWNFPTRSRPVIVELLQECTNEKKVFVLQKNNVIYQDISKKFQM